jgi:hypothetical protein
MLTTISFMLIISFPRLSQGTIASTNLAAFAFLLAPYF